MWHRRADSSHQRAVGISTISWFGHMLDWLMHVTLFVVMIGFYAFYQPAGDAWYYVRFLLPCLPQLVMFATAGVAGIWERLQGTYQPPVKHLAPFHRLRHRSA